MLVCEACSLGWPTLCCAREPEQAQCIVAASVLRPRRRSFWARRSTTSCSTIKRGSYPSLRYAFKSLRASLTTGSTVLIVSPLRSEEHTSELQSLMRISYAVFCLKKKKKQP